MSQIQFLLGQENQKRVSAISFDFLRKTKNPGCNTFIKTRISSFPLLGVIPFWRSSFFHTNWCLDKAETPWLRLLSVLRFSCNQNHVEWKILAWFIPIGTQSIAFYFQGTIIIWPTPSFWLAHILKTLIVLGLQQCLFKFFGMATNWMTSLKTLVVS